MKHVKTLNKPNLKESAKNGNCGKCHSSCQSYGKTDDTTVNQGCDKQKEK